MFTPNGGGAAGGAYLVRSEIIDGKILLCFPYVKMSFSLPANIRNMKLFVNRNLNKNALKIIYTI